MAFRTPTENLAWLYFQYLLVTGLYVLEPWEKSIFNSVLLSVAAMAGYTSYVFVPVHLRLALRFFSDVFGGQAESAVALVS
ncbi:unnamed protein product [Lota lota]